MAATAVLNLAPNGTAVANSRNEENINSTPSRRLSFAASNVAGENFTSSPQFRLQRRRYGDHSERRNPVIVSPKAVSDSQNSQTCLDPDASRSVLGIILGGGAGTRLYPLTKKRAKPAVPLGANYRARAFPHDRSHLRLRFLLQSCRLIHPRHEICRARFLRHLLQFPGPAQSIVTVVDGHGIFYQIVDGVMTE